MGIMVELMEAMMVGIMLLIMALVDVVFVKLQIMPDSLVPSQTCIVGRMEGVTTHLHNVLDVQTATKNPPLFKTDLEDQMHTAILKNDGVRQDLITI